MPLSAFIGAGPLSRDRRHTQSQGKPLPRTWYRPLQLLCSFLARPFVGGLRRRVRELESELAVLNSCSIVSSTDASGRITHVNELFCYLSGYSREELIGRNHNVINSGHHPRKFFMDMYRNIATGHPWRGEIRNRARNGEHFWLDITIIPTTDSSGRVLRVWNTTQ